MENKNHYISFGRLGQFHPTTVMACFSLFYVAAWTSVAVILFGPPLFNWDIITELMWGRDWLLLPPQHPPLPNWLINIFFELGGPWTTAIIGPLSQALCLFIVYLFARRLFDHHKALLSAMLLMGISFYNTLDIIEYTHNTAHPIFWILTIYLFHACLRDKGLHYWCFLGVAAAACFLVKYTAVFLLICVPAWLLLDPKARKLLQTPGPWISLLIFLLLVSPHITYFYLYDGSIRNPPYAHASVRDAILQCTRTHWFMFIILALTGFLWKGTIEWGRPLTRDDRFLLVFALLPFLLVFLAGGITNQKYFINWFWPFFTLSGLLAMRFFGGRATLERCHWGIYACIALLMITPAFVLTRAAYQGKMFHDFDYKEGTFTSFSDLADKIDATFTQYAKYDPPRHRILVAPYSLEKPLAGAVYMMAKPQPKLFFEANPHWSPAIDQKTLCDSTIILSFKGQASHYTSRIKKIISDCVAQGIKPIKFDYLVRYNKPLLAEKPHPPFKIQLILLKKD